MTNTKKCTNPKYVILINRARPFNWPPDLAPLESLLVSTSQLLTCKWNIKGSKQDVLYRGQLRSLIITLRKFILLCLIVDCRAFHEWQFIIYLFTHYLFTHSLVYRCSGSLQVLAIVNGSAVNTLAHGSLPKCGIGFSKQCLYSFARAAVTKNHRLGVLNDRNLLSYSSEGYESKIKASAGLVLLRAEWEGRICSGSLFGLWRPAPPVSLYFVFPLCVSVSKFPLFIRIPVMVD